MGTKLCYKTCRCLIIEDLQLVLERIVHIVVELQLQMVVNRWLSCHSSGSLFNSIQVSAYIYECSSQGFKSYFAIAVHVLTDANMHSWRPQHCNPSSHQQCFYETTTVQANGGKICILTLKVIRNSTCKNQNNNEANFATGVSLQNNMKRGNPLILIHYKNLYLSNINFLCFVDCFLGIQNLIT